ncbi:MAG TPA: S1C family serine protease [Anaerolineales bacterium]
MNSKVVRPFIWLIVLILVVSLACQSQSPAATTPPTTPPTAPPAKPAETIAPLPTKEATVATQASTAAVPAPSDQGLVSNLQDAQKAVIQIEATGTFIDPQVGVVFNGAGRGSGFIIDPSGIAVTAHHVVAGAALLKVWVGGNKDTTYNATVLGVSECSDLAVIQIKGGPFPYMQWFSGTINVGQDLYVAGFPLGEPEYSLVKGIISKAKANGETNWSSVQSVIEYDAATNPGNSGGPVITPDGKVLGIHYAGNSKTRQAFGISEEIAKGVVDQLKTGKNIDTIGVNGQAVASEDGKLTGVWVSSVDSGSPADKAGIKAGDIINQLENLVLATDGTMADYCSILRSHKPADTLDVKVIRYATGELLSGQLNGREMKVTGTFDTGNGTQTAGTQNGGTPAPAGNPNASKSGDYFFSTQFENTDGWYTFAIPKSDNYKASVDHSKLYVEVDDNNSNVYAMYNLDLVPSDVRIDADVETVAGPNRNNISVVCRASQDGWYEFSINSGGLWYIWKYANGQYGDPLGQGASYAINLQKSKNTITATCIGDALTLYANGTKLGTAHDHSFTGGGQVGLSVSTFDISGAGVDISSFIASVP